MDLRKFLKYLEKYELLELDMDNEEGTYADNVLKVQKYVFFGQCFGLDLPFSYNTRVRGPYSNPLAATFFQIVCDGELYESISPYDPHDVDGSDSRQHFDSRRFLNLVKGKDDNWLEIAAEVISQNDHPIQIENNMTHVRNLDDPYWYAYIYQVLIDLMEAGLGNLVFQFCISCPYYTLEDFLCEQE